MRIVSFPMFAPLSHRVLRSIGFPLAAIALSACGGGGGSGAQAQQGGPVTPAPTISFSATPTTVSSGQTSSLSWSSTNATSCTASGAWSGNQPLTGTATTAALTQTQEFTLSCNGGGGGAVARVTVTVSQPQVGTPTVQLSASPPGVALNGNTTLNWSSTNSTSCTASGAWTGSRALSGSQSVGPISQDQTYQMTCQGANGNALAMVTVNVRQATLSWTAPTQNVDGTPLTNLSGFKVYWGSTSRSYPNSTPVNGAGNTSHVLALNPGTYFFAVTAVDAGGNESAPSNEVSKTLL